MGFLMAVDSPRAAVEIQLVFPGVKMHATIMPRIPGVQVRGPELFTLRNTVARLLGSKNSGFSGAQPISFTAKHIDELKSENYFVSEKADGIRCLMFTTVNSRGKGETYLIDRHNDYYFLNFGLPKDARSGAMHYDSLVDGELVLDTYDDGKQVLWFLLFDCMAVDGKGLVDRPYHKRLGHLREFILNPFREAVRRDPSYASRQPFKMDLKKLHLAYHLKMVFEEMPTLKHKSDGIIFTSKDAAYGLGTCNKMLKWKPADENTVDFKVKVIGSHNKPKFVLQLWKGGYEYVDHGVLTLSPDEESWLRDPPDGRIIECRYDPSWPAQWRFHRFRDDKANANHVNTYDKIMISIGDGVSKEELLNSAPEIRERYKDREKQGTTPS